MRRSGLVHWTQVLNPRRRKDNQLQSQNTPVEYLNWEYHFDTPAFQSKKSNPIYSKGRSKAHTWWFSLCIICKVWWRNNINAPSLLLALFAEIDGFPAQKPSNIECYTLLAATKQLYEWFRPPISRLPVCPSVHLSHLFDNVPALILS